jgi:phosphatidate phosphatase APP1
MMTTPGYHGSDSGLNESSDGSKYLASNGAQGGERASRRQKLAGYLKAANELRQSYKQSTGWSSRETEQSNEDELRGIPGAFPDVAIARYGDEELVLFPSYCKRHQKEEPRIPTHKHSAMPSSGDEEGPSDAEFWKKEWDRWENDKAIVDVDVRGWVYSPHRGPMTRKNRFLVGLARQLSGIPAPKTEKSGSREGSPDKSTSLSRHEAQQAARDQERILKEADEILKRGKSEAAAASRGKYSEQPKDDSDSDTIYSATRGRSVTTDEPPGPGRLSSRASWNQPSDMSAAELASANKNLMARIMPFMTNPLVSTPITLFFYDKTTSQSKTVMTNEAGHFNIRAALDFIPTHVRVLASEGLSATEEIKITEPKGVSLISDVDDTIKHSSISSGAREIFRNAFIRDLHDLTIEGVKEWYNTMFDMGVGIHYVSNSPWQLFPVLVSYFQTAELPPGSYHLKQYSGMLQGIFEPVAERKKGTLERIMRDFPQRKFLLVGDSGEADLEVYTDVALANPGRVIGVFIRDVTTPEDRGFFDSAMTKLEGRGDHRRNPSREWSGSTTKSTRAPVDAPESRPKLPPRNLTVAAPETAHGPAIGQLIDFSDEPEVMQGHEAHKRIPPRSNSDLAQLDPMNGKYVSSSPSKTPPTRPHKPTALRSMPSESQFPKSGSSRAPPPPPPRKRQKEPSDAAPLNHPLSQTHSLSDLQSPDESYVSQARHKVAAAYNALPPVSSYMPTRSSPPFRPVQDNKQFPVPPGRRSNKLSWSKSDSRPSSPDGSDDDADLESQGSTPKDRVNKKLDLWIRRVKHAQEVLGQQGIEFRTWRTGTDVAHISINLAEKHLRAMGVEGYGPGQDGSTVQGGGEKKVKDLKN